jgi:hypothetical protein
LEPNFSQNFYGSNFGLIFSEPYRFSLRHQVKYILIFPRTLNCFVSNFRTNIIIRKPNLYNPRWIIFLLPFFWHTWIAVGITWFILSVSLEIIQHVRYCCEHVEKDDLSILKSAMLVTTVFLQQGTAVLFLTLATVYS